MTEPNNYVIGLVIYPGMTALVLHHTNSEGVEDKTAEAQRAQRKRKRG